MTAQKGEASASPRTQPSKAPGGEAPAARKPWIKKSPVDVVLEQITKQEKRVNGMREELKHEERELQKLQQAKKVLEGS